MIWILIRPINPPPPNNMGYFDSRDYLFILRSESTNDYGNFLALIKHEMEGGLAGIEHGMGWKGTPYIASTNNRIAYNK